MLLLLHLSDLHLTGKSDKVVPRIPRLVEAVRNLHHNITACIIAVTGDVTFAGREEEYEAAHGLLSTLFTLLSEQLPNTVQPTLLLVPGNHDCDFSSAHPAREQLLQKLTGEHMGYIDDAMIEICTAPQSNYFSFVDAVTATDTPIRERLIQGHVVVVDDLTVAFHCANTAWLSQRIEQQGRLYFPHGALPTERGGHALTVALFHHPYNWLEASHARVFRERIEAIADIVLTGHEHDLTLRLASRPHMGGNAYLEGGALQEYGSDDSAFNAVLFDLPAGRQQVFQFEWAGAMYAARDASPGWTPY